MNLQPITPELRPGQQVACAKCGRMTNKAMADLDATAFTFLCADCQPKKPAYIHIHGRRWFDRVNGNTYHSVAIFVDGEQVHKIPFTYGYGNQYEWNAAMWLDENGYLPGRKHHANGGSQPLWDYCQANGIKLQNEVDDVPRKRDL